MLAGSHPESSSSAERRLRRAREHVSKRWFPVNRGLLAKIRKGLDEGVYDLDVDFLITEIKTDFGLFTQCLATLTGMLRRERHDLPEQLNPVSIFEHAGLDRIRRVLNDASLFNSDHSLEQINEAQFACLQQALISASTAEVLAAQHNIHPQVGYSVGLLRQLGLTLVAWNYPKTYLRAAAQHHHDLELELSRTLGFSPTLLAVSLVRDWGLSDEIRCAMGESGTRGVSQISLRLQKICEVGEALARANDPEHYPEAKSAWEHARRQICAMLGSDDLQLIRERVRHNCESYIAQYPELFEGIEEVDPVKRIEELTRAGTALRNPWIKLCPPRLKRRLTELYERLGSKDIDKENLGVLVRELIPLAGFTGGCVYVVDPAANTLMPRVKIGQPRLHECKPLPCQHNGSGSPIYAAYACSAPIMETALPDRTGGLSCLAATFGGARKVGVLYLEIPDTPLRATDPNKLHRFRALLQALDDCLQLR